MRRLCIILCTLSFPLLGTTCPHDTPADIPDISIPEVPAPSDKGACCPPSGTCDDSGNHAACDAAGGYWHGISTTCEDVQVCNSTGPFDDECANARMMEGDGPFAFNTNQDRSGAESGVPRDAGCKKIWMDAFACFTAPQSGMATFSTCSDNGSVDTVLAVYSGCECLPTLERHLACNDNSCGTESEVTIQVEAGQSYLVHAGENYAELDGGLVEVTVTFGTDSTPGDGTTPGGTDGSGNTGCNFGGPCQTEADCCGLACHNGSCNFGGPCQTDADCNGLACVDGYCI